VPNSKQLRTDAQRTEWLLAKLDDYIAKPVVRGGIEPPTFRFRGLAFPQVTPPTQLRRAIRMRHQCFTTIDRGSFAASP